MSRPADPGPGCPTQPGLWPVSVKGVVVRDGRVLVLRNERDEWELPGGRLEPVETPGRCVVREIAEESGWRVTAGPLLDAWVYEVLPGRRVLILTYGCTLAPGQDAPVVSSEHAELALVSAAELTALPMPAGYRRSVASWLTGSG